MTTLDGLLEAVVADPLEETRWLVLADWLEEFDDPRRAELLRLHRRLIATCCEPDVHPERPAWQSRIVELIGQAVKPCVPQRTMLMPGDVPMTFSFIPPGRFLMGSKEGSSAEEPVHKVTLTKGFFMGIHPVTQSQWKAVMGTEPSHFKGADRPVEQVSWTDAVGFCTKLTASLKGQSMVRLPTEAEWEYACRAGTSTEYFTGDKETDLQRAGWYGVNSDDQTHPVGQLVANPWLLHDVHGNVWEWCSDWYGEYPSNDQIDPQGQSSGNYRVLRGGSWYGNPGYCVSACRSSNGPATRNINCGFRVCFRLE